MNDRNEGFTSKQYVKFGNNSGCVSAKYNISTSNYDGEVFIVPYDSEASGRFRHAESK